MNLSLAQRDDLTAVVALVRRYHAHDGLASPEPLEDAVAPLLGDNDLGRIWWIERDGARVGYAAVCFGYSLEFGGRDAFLDELFVLAEHRGVGVGGAAVDLLCREVEALGVRALHLEVAHGNEAGRAAYRRSGFTERDGYRLMSRRLR